MDDEEDRYYDPYGRYGHPQSRRSSHRDGFDKQHQKKHTAPAQKSSKPVKKGAKKPSKKKLPQKSGGDK